MARYLLSRIGQGIFTIVLLAVIVFLLSRATGNPLDLVLPIEAPPELRERMAEQLGLDRSIPEQFLIYVSDIIRGDFGDSVRYRQPVLELFGDRLPNSMSLVIPSFLLAFLVGVPLGVISAVRRSGLVGKILDVVAVLGVSAPPFWIGLLLILIFAVELGWLPSSRAGGLLHHVLPVVTLSFFLIAGIMRLVRSSMLEVLQSDFITFARVKGTPERSVIWRHALRNSLSAAVSFAGVYFAILITGSIVIEKVFAWPGAGRLLYDGILNRDYPIVQGIVIIGGALIVLVNLLIDVAYGLLDPRIRVSG